MHIFVSGTDTNVGKTVVSAALCLKFKRRYWKPIQSGTREKTDSQVVGEFLGADRVLKEKYKFREPLSPHLSSALEGTKIEIKKIVRALSMIKDPLIIEGAGGLMVPINRNQFMLDLIAHINCEVILVARTCLGTINHTLLSISALREKGLKLSGIILNGEPNVKNRRAIEEFGKVKVFGTLSPISPLNRTNLEQALDALNSLR